MNEEKQPVFNLNQKTKSIILSVCAVIALVGLVTASIASGDTPDIVAEQTTQGSAEGVEAKVTNIPDDREIITVAPTTEYKTEDMIIVTDPMATTEQERSAPTSYSLPLGTDIGKDYSRGVPVYSDVMGDWRVHNGVDFNGAYGDGVKAIASGYVKAVYTDDVMGDTVVVNHGGGIVATYFGVTADAEIKKGVYVEECDRLGTLSVIPSEATEEFPHLHLEIEKNGEICDPLEIMGLY